MTLISVVLWATTAPKEELHANGVARRPSPEAPPPRVPRRTPRARGGPRPGSACPALLAVFHLIAQVVVEVDLHVVLVGRFQIKPLHDDEPPGEAHIGQQIVQLFLGRVVPGCPVPLNRPQYRCRHAGDRTGRSHPRRRRAISCVVRRAVARQAAMSTAVLRGVEGIGEEFLAVVGRECGGLAFDGREVLPDPGVVSGLQARSPPLCVSRASRAAASRSAGAGTSPSRPSSPASVGTARCSNSACCRVSTTA